MKSTALFIVAFLATISVVAQNHRVTDYVNPFTGTGGHKGIGFGNTFPGAAYPFGMIQLGPDNGNQGWEYCSGYHYPDSIIAGFSHTHLSGTGVGDFADISLMPTTKSIDKKYFVQSDESIREYCTENGVRPDQFLNRDGHPAPFTRNYLLKYRAKFSHNEEKATAGYYSVRLPEDDIQVELTTSERVGMHRYRFNKESAQQHLILNLGFHINDDRCTDGFITCKSPQIATGYRFSSGKAGVQRVYFAMQFSRPVSNYQHFLEEVSGLDYARGKQLAGVFTFDGKQGKELLIKVAISSVSVEGALRNLKTADKLGWDFDGMKEATRKKWNDELSKIDIVTGNEEKKSTFYTALYHSYLVPYLFSDTDGQYKNFKQQADKATGYRQYTVLSLWDTFRALNPLLTLLQPAVEGDIISSMLAKYKQTGELPYWEIAGNEGGSMIGYHAASLIADAMDKKIGNFDPELALEAMVKTSLTNRKGLDFYRQYHFVPTDKEKSGTVSKTLEYCYDDWCIARVAKQLGKMELFKKYTERSEYYKNLYDPAYHLMRGKNSNGSWYEPFHPRFAEYGNPHTVEGNTWQYSFFAPHDMDGLIKLYCGKAGLEMMLDSLFTQTKELLGEDTDDVTGQIGQYAQGNEPSHHVAYLYDFIGKPKKSQFYTNMIINTLYGNGPEGLCGNEDCGQMSAWYVFSSMGFYPVNPVDGKYYFGSPQFESAAITLPNGKNFTIKAHNVSAENIFIKSTKLNGKPIERNYLTYDELQKGGLLEFEMINK